MGAEWKVMARFQKYAWFDVVIIHPHLLPSALNVNEGRCHQCVSPQGPTRQEGPRRHNPRLSGLEGH